MRKLIVAALLLTTMTVYAQQNNAGDTAGKPKTKVEEATRLEKQPDTTEASLQGQDTGATRLSPEEQERIDRNLQSLVRIQKENRDKQKRAAFIRIGIGVLLLVVLVVGLRRKSKQTKP